MTRKSYLPEEQNIRVDLYKQLRDAENIEEILCLSTLINAGKLPSDSTVNDAQDFYRDLTGCEECPFKLKCLVCTINN